MKAFVFDPLWPSLLNKEHEQKLADAGVEVVLATQIKPLAETPDLYYGEEDRLLCLNPDYVDWSLKSSDYSTIPNLKAIIGAATGFEWIDNTYANTAQIPIVNIRNFSTDAVAEWAILMALSLARKLPMLIKSGFPLNLGSDFQTYLGVSLVGKTAGIVGLGNIGSAIAKRCEGLGMKVIYWSASPKDTIYEYASLEEVFKNSDFIFPTLADNPDTRELVTSGMIESIKQSVIISTIMHKSSFHDLLISNVASNKLAGYGFEDDKSSNFTNYKGNIWAAPAYAWCTKESLAKSMDLFVEAIVGAANNKYPNKVN